MQGGGVSPARVEFEYADNGERKLLERFADATGTTLVGSTSYDYFANGLSKTITHTNAAGATLVNYDYLYDLAGRLKSEMHHGETYQYSYDKTGQLLTVNKGGSLFESFSYDKNGNRKTSTGPNGNQVYTPAGAGNRLQNDGQNSYTYDGEGNLLTKTVIATAEITEYTWDYRNQLVRVEVRTSGGIVLSESDYKYDSTGRQVSQSTNGNTLITIYDRDLAWHDVVAVGTVAAHYLFSDRIDEIIARDNSGAGVTWHLADKLGTVRDLLGNSGIIVNSMSYTAFGQILSQSSLSALDRFTFTGREFNYDSNLYFYRARFYNEYTGRFISEDPLGFKGGDVNLSRYANANPLSFTDPFGTSVTIEFALLLSITVPVIGVFGVGLFDGQPCTAVANNPFGFSFSQACTNHDACYDGPKSGKTKAECDEDFLKDLREACKTSRSGLSCFILAIFYYLGVQLPGLDFYTPAK
jgi:RHS repeat-associated protein